MSRLAQSLAVVAAAMMSYPETSLAAEDAAGDVTVARDLAAVIALQGQSCGRVVSARRQGEVDWIASCQDGNRYRVFMNADGRVVVEKLD